MDLVVTEVQILELVEVSFFNMGDDLYVIELQVQLGQIPQVFELLESYFVIGEIQGCHVLEITEVLFNNIDDLLGSQLTVDGLVGKSHAAGAKDEETVEKLADFVCLLFQLV